MTGSDYAEALRSAVAHHKGGMSCSFDRFMQIYYCVMYVEPRALLQSST